jgi:hypothetical protein
VEAILMFYAQQIDTADRCAPAELFVGFKRENMNYQDQVFEHLSIYRRSVMNSMKMVFSNTVAMRFRRSYTSGEV